MHWAEKHRQVDIQLCLLSAMLTLSYRPKAQRRGTGSALLSNIMHPPRLDSFLAKSPGHGRGKTHTPH